MDRKGAQQLLCAFASTRARGPAECPSSMLDWTEGAHVRAYARPHPPVMHGNFTNKAGALGRGADQKMDMRDSNQWKCQRQQRVKSRDMADLELSICAVLCRHRRQEPKVSQGAFARVSRGGISFAGCNRESHSGAN